MGVNDTQLYQLLTELDYIPEEDLKRAQQIAKTKSISLYDALISLDLVSDENLGKLTASSLDVPFISLAQTGIPEKFLKITPESIAQKHRVITFESDGDVLKLATSDPSQTSLFETLAKKAGTKHYRIHFATDRDIGEALNLYKKHIQSTFEDILGKGTGGLAEPPISKIIDTLVEYGYNNKASDVHIEPFPTVTVVRFRIDGILHDAIKLPSTLHNQIISRIKIAAKLRTDDHLSAQDGRMSHAVGDDEVDIRVSILPIISGEKAVLRLLSSKSRQFGLTDLGMEESNLAKIRNAYQKPYGMILSTGPTGCGKTTSMYAIVKIINTRERNISTIEDPVEYAVEGINQIQVNVKSNLTFANGLRSILRQDPDTIFVGEIRDEETAGIAINSALTGHLVLSTMHTNDAATALPRFIDMGIEPFLVASTVNVIIAQRLLRKICTNCKVSAELTRVGDNWEDGVKTLRQQAALSSEHLKQYFGKRKSIRLYYGKGCNACHQSGYQGRVGIFEILEISPTIQKLVIEKADSDEITRQAVKEGMTTMFEDAMKKVEEGITTVDEALRVTQ